MNAARAPRVQHGFALIGALFVLLVLAALGAFAVRANMNQQHGSTLELDQLRAQAALDTWLEYAAARLLASPADNCGNLVPLPNLPGGFSVTFAGCGRVQYADYGVTWNVYTVSGIVASRGAYGTPEYVRRDALSVRIVETR